VPFLHDLPTVTGDRMGFEFVQALVEDFAGTPM